MKRKFRHPFSLPHPPMGMRHQPGGGGAETGKPGAWDGHEGLRTGHVRVSRQKAHGACPHWNHRTLVSACTSAHPTPRHGKKAWALGNGKNIPEHCASQARPAVTPGCSAHRSRPCCRGRSREPQTHFQVQGHPSGKAGLPGKVSSCHNVPLGFRQGAPRRTTGIQTRTPLSSHG